uniref:6,7-dimethyl-8-ribityllumazine synthase n=1 Tax=Phytophthora ramorum TaxID=164328 RepID=H3GS05_PHYRM
MSTLTSTDMGELKRPTTRVHAPPGGGSSWSFGDDSAPTPTGRKRFVQPQAQQDTKMESPHAAPPAVPVQPVVSAAVVAPVPAGAVRVALLKTSSDAELVDRVVQNCFEKLEGQAVSSETFTVASLEQLPYAANKLTEFGGFDGVICFGFLNTQEPQFPALSAALTQSFIDISVKNVRPVVRAVFIGEPRVASVKVKGGWGAEFADGVVSLVQLGGFKGSK